MGHAIVTETAVETHGKVQPPRTPTPIAIVPRWAPTVDKAQHNAMATESDVAFLGNVQTLPLPTPIAITKQRTHCKTPG